MAQKTTLTPPEWMVMKALWGKGPQSLSEVIASMGNSVDWSYTTYSTYLAKLVRKGFVGFEARGRDKFYYPLAEKEACIEAEGRGLIEKISEHSAKQLLVSMIRESNLTKEDQEELKALIDELAKEGD